MNISFIHRKDLMTPFQTEKHTNEQFIILFDSSLSIVCLRGKRMSGNSGPRQFMCV